MLVFLFTLSSVFLIAALTIPVFADLLLIAAPCALASLLLLISQIDRYVNRPVGEKLVVIDGSNVMHWKDGKPRIETVRDVIDALHSKGYQPGVIFDANAGHVLTGRYRHDAWFSKKLDIPRDRVRVVGKGTQADPEILITARAYEARVVTNDRYRDWAKDHPEIRKPGYLVRGGYKSGEIWLSLPGLEPEQTAPARKESQPA